MNFYFAISLFFFPLSCLAQHTEPIEDDNKVFFSNMEMNHVRVTTPHLFEFSDTIFIKFDSTASDFCFPLKGGQLISDYGTSSRRSHSGCDIKTFAGDTIRATFAGIVRMSKAYGDYGNLIVIRHSNGLETVYSHNLKNLCHSRDSVYAGSPIAIVGRTGRATTEHLHLETRINGTHFNPNLLFNINNNSLLTTTLKACKTASGTKIEVVR